MSSLVKYNKQQIGALRELAMIAARSGNYANMSQETLLNLMLSAADFGVSPMKAINGSFHVIKGKIIMSGHLISERIRAAGHSLKVIEYSREKCVIIGQRKDNGDSFKCEFDMEDAKAANLLKNPSWINYPKDMLFNRAMSRMGRVLFSDVVGACYSEDEANDIQEIPSSQRRMKDPDEGILPLTAEVVEEVEQKLGDQQECADSLEKLRESFELDGIDTQHFDEFMALLEIQKKESRESLAGKALAPEILPGIKRFYLKKFGPVNAEQQETPV